MSRTIVILTKKIDFWEIPQAFPEKDFWTVQEAALEVEGWPSAPISARNRRKSHTHVWKPSDAG